MFTAVDKTQQQASKRRTQDSSYTNKNKDVFPGDALADLKVASLQARRDDAPCSLSCRHSGMAFWSLMKL